MDGIGWAAAAMDAARRRLDVAAENLANGSTDGFQKTLLRGSMRPGGIELQQLRDGSQGALRHTGRPFDLALTGNGAFKLRDGAGRVVESRDGHFSRDRFGRLRDDAGRVLQGKRGAIVVPPGAMVSNDGSIVRNGSILDRISLPHGSSVHSGFLESSNADAISEMLDVMTAQRSFEAAEKIVAAIDSTRERAATQVGAVKS